MYVFIHLLIHSPTGHLGDVQVFPPLNNTATNVVHHSSCVRDSLDQTRKSRSAGLQGRYIFNSLENAVLFSKMAVPLGFHQQWLGVPVA